MAAITQRKRPLAGIIAAAFRYTAQDSVAGHVPTATMYSLVRATASAKAVLTGYKVVTDARESQMDFQPFVAVFCADWWADTCNAEVRGVACGKYSTDKEPYTLHSVSLLGQDNVPPSMNRTVCEQHLRA